MRSLTPEIGDSSGLRRRASARAARPGVSRHRGCDDVSALYVVRLPSAPFSTLTKRPASLSSRAR
jgi:hypothetical protein